MGILGAVWIVVFAVILLMVLTGQKRSREILKGYRKRRSQ